MTISSVDMKKICLGIRADMIVANLSPMWVQNPTKVKVDVCEMWSREKLCMVDVPVFVAAPEIVV